jgi:pyrimidine operon attenuation protein/uracil phosphoribosyltransferase
VSEAPLREKGLVMDGAAMERTLARLAGEIVERRSGLGRLVLVGVRSRGVPLAERLAGALARAAGQAPPVGALDISLYRDDFTTIAPQPLTKGTEIPFTIDGQDVLLVDDVLYTGRTVRCALDELIDFGRPARIELLVLVDRGHRELPIRADYVGQTVETARDEIVQVLLEEEDGRDGVVLMERAPGSPAAVAAPATPEPAAPESSPPRSARTSAGRKDSSGRGARSVAGRRGTGRVKTRRGSRARPRPGGERPGRAKAARSHSRRDTRRRAKR